MAQEMAARCFSCGAPLAPPAAFAEENPYAAPRVGVSRAVDPPDLDQILASRFARLLAQIVDLLINIPVCIPGAILIVLGADPDREEFSPTEEWISLMGVLLLVAGLLGFNIFQWVLLARDGQTVGKKVLGIRIVRHDTGGPAGFGRAVGLRVWLNLLLSNLPCVGAFYPLADILFIFGEDRRCIHDRIAGTKVIAD